MADKHKDRMAARKARVEAAKASAAETPSGSNSEPAEPITDYWSLPKTGPKTTLINSAWTWTLLTYAFIIVAVLATIAQQELDIFSRGWIGAVILVSLLYPAWRIGSLVSRFLKRRGIGADFDMPAVGASKASKEADPESVEGRMAARRARVEKAREDGKL